jgi:hypothetical protein
MTKKKELEQALRLTDEMILIQGIVLIKEGVRLVRWNASEQISQLLDELEAFIHAEQLCCTFGWKHCLLVR